ncbi:MAG: vanadium-dependent haloperoxidase [Litoreibacter sp.]
MAKDKATYNSANRPDLEGHYRRAEATSRRAAANQLAHSRPVHKVPSNNEEQDFPKSQATSFTKGLPHDEYGLVKRADYEVFVKATVEPDYDYNVPPAPSKERKWESPVAGHYFTLQGPDPDAVAMAPAPKLGGDELCAEIATVYAMALTRDIPFSAMADGTHKIGCTYPEDHPRAGQEACVQDLVDELRKLAWFDTEAVPVGHYGETLTELEHTRRSTAWEDASNGLTVATLFRGSTDGARKGPYVSQFMLLGTSGNDVGKGAMLRDPLCGQISYGAQTIDQRIEQNQPANDFMTGWDEWLGIQRGEAPKKSATYTGLKRFITSARDMASYVHVDQLYQAYLNAALILLKNGAAFDEGSPILNRRNAEVAGFATFGGPHLLSLVTEVATRGLRAVRRQKFQIHRRARPEVVAARITLVANNQGGRLDVNACDAIEGALRDLGHENPADCSRPGVLLHWIAQLNARCNGSHQPKAGFKLNPEHNYLLPMAFPEGSPMHPSYGAGHATVAGACVTILKAFFDQGVTMKDALKVDAMIEPSADGGSLVESSPPIPTQDVSLESELDKLAANISIARNMAGVHYFTDYFDSARMGERVAVGMLEEQMLTYSEPVSMTFTSFDGDKIEICTDGGNAAASVQVRVNDGAISRDEWWSRHVIEYAETVFA